MHWKVLQNALHHNLHNSTYSKYFWSVHLISAYLSEMCKESMACMVDNLHNRLTSNSEKRTKSFVTTRKDLKISKIAYMIDMISRGS